MRRQEPTWVPHGDSGEPSEAPAPWEGRYEDRGLLARGGMGEVRRAWDRRLDCAVVIKLLGWERVDDPGARARFLAEATLTARLAHPGVVAVHDRGVLPDGRAWYTMAEVRGRTLADVLEEAHRRGLDEGATRQLVGLVRRLCEPVAHAHRQGVVHRDLKPENLMIGPFGEALVMDWGLACGVGEAGPRPVAGTPAYMPPEQALPGVALGPAADVYALGGVLWAVLRGGPPRGGSTPALLAALRAGAPPPLPAEGLAALPPPLARLCERAMDPDPARRPPDAAAFAEQLDAWLGGEARREEARRLLAEADTRRPALDTLRARAEELEESARKLRAALPPYAGAAEKEPVWAREDAAEQARRAVIEGETRWVEQVRAALAQDPDLPEAHTRLAAHYAGQLREAEARRDGRAATTAAAMFASHARGADRALLEDLTLLDLESDPPGAEVLLRPLRTEGRRLVPGPEEALGTTPLRGAALPIGSHELLLRAPGCVPVVHAVHLERGRRWDGVAPGEPAARPLRLPRAGELGPDDCLVPPGWCWTGGDEQAPECLPRRRVWVDGFVMRRHPVTLAEYLPFLDELVAAGRGEEARDAAPRARVTRTPGEEPPLVEPGPDGRHALGGLDGRLPVVMLPLRAVLRYLDWHRARTGLPWRLPDELEWEKAARGVDGRWFPWGDQPEPSWANLAGATAEAPVLRPVGSFPVDRSPYGIEDLAGNSRDWCANEWTEAGPPSEGGRLRREVPADNSPALRSVRGGSWQSAVHLGRAAARFAGHPHRAHATVGFRLVRSLD